jgi:hypothetical protein
VGVCITYVCMHAGVSYAYSLPVKHAVTPKGQGAHSVTQAMKVVINVCVDVVWPGAGAVLQ